MDSLRDQYEAYPYPTRDPNSPALIPTVCNDLRTINHYLFQGRKKSFDGFRALVAGGGTGDATVHLASQLSRIAPDALVAHVDLSQTSIAIAKKRIEKLGLSNVRFIRGSFMGSSELGDLRFDYINCSGVLHHLENPVAGGIALRSLLAPNGGLSAMLYGALGRTRIYHTQEILALLKRPTDKLRDLIPLTRALLSDLPGSNYSVSLGSEGKLTHDVARLVDTFLNVRDRAYRVAQVYELLNASGFRLTSFLPRILYDPLQYLHAPELAERIHSLPTSEKHQVAELLLGGPANHIFFAVASERPDPVTADPQDLQLAPHLLMNLPASSSEPAIQFGGRFPCLVEGQQARMVHAIDGSMTIGNLIDSFSENQNAGVEICTPTDSWIDLFETLNSRHRLVLAPPSPLVADTSTTSKK